MCKHSAADVWHWLDIIFRRLGLFPLWKSGSCVSYLLLDCVIFLTGWTSTSIMCVFPHPPPPPGHGDSQQLDPIFRQKSEKNQHLHKITQCMVEITSVICSIALKLGLCIFLNGNNSYLKIVMVIVLYHYPPMDNIHNRLKLWVNILNLENKFQGYYPFTLRPSLYDFKNTEQWSPPLNTSNVPDHSPTCIGLDEYERLNTMTVSWCLQCVARPHETTAFKCVMTS